MQQLAVASIRNDLTKERHVVTLLECLPYGALAVDVGVDQTGVGDPSSIKIGYSSREPRRVSRPCIKIGYVSAMY